MDPRTTTTGRRGPLALRRRPPAAVRRPALYLGVAVTGAVLVNSLVGVEPTAQAEAGTSQSVSVAEELGLSAQSGPIDVTEDLAPLEDLAASRSTREADQAAAQQAQAAADQAELDRQTAEAEALARAEAEKKAAEEAAAAAAAAEQEAAAAPASPTQQARAAATAAASVAATAVARISNTAGSVRSQTQSAADAVVSNVPGAAGITLGGTRASAADPGGHPSGLALDYMVMSNAALGDAIVEYHRAHWAELGVDYLIWQQRMLSSPGGSWQAMENRGSATANHMDHVHVNYN
ncbi:hypothetical protein SAMN04515665_1042 [Blastococcus sp. DSM 46786]|uniref:hypothetical protein n=1 Tax=Blastococcus sp. DSM 46786 TaxID=1798227 RepID=UPI0008AE7351|nr:hypothetical protein [Blastococcus sp. DSM 46786]SEK64566.1 hypothetical protein SAMN04515665_1042 [Blastococcus sp. DSM 46786]